MLNELLEDIMSLCEESGLSEAVINNTTSLKRKLIDVYGEDIAFFLMENSY